MSIQFVNQSSIVTAEAFAAFLADFEDQLANALAPVWGLTPVPAGTIITLLDETGPNDQAGDLGYHDVGTNGIAYGRVFCVLAEKDGVPWSVVASHEGCELSVDQRCNQGKWFPDFPGAQTGWFVIQEVADPCEMSSYPGKVHGTPLSDFAYPGWFMPGYTGQVDFLKKLLGPMKIASGGYASAMRVGEAGQWQSFNAFMEQSVNPM